MNGVLKTTLMLAAAGAISAASPTLVMAAQVTPPVSISAWERSGVCSSSAHDGDITLSLLANPRYGYVTTSGSDALGVSPLTLDSNSRGNGIENNGSRIVSEAFHAVAADQIDVHFNFGSSANQMGKLKE
jgi:hypothetical protein